ncbi:MAG TPA: class I SAM-dependent methyltransferase [Burkholderiaceae bacterium]|nr:class I SAM-dependent methyltransferase [Burkholderiaceae bacterium]
MFAALLRDGRINDAARIVDVGCGLGILAAWLAAAERCDPHIVLDWPATWAPPPKRWTLRGFDLRRDAIAVGQRALSDLGDRVALTVGDARQVTLPACDVVVVLDVLHYLDSEHQRKLLVDVFNALTPGGALLVRVGDAASHWRARVTSMVDWCVTIMRDRQWPRLHCRPLSEWKLLLESIGFSAVAQPMSEGTPFANVLLIATKESAER